MAYLYNLQVKRGEMGPRQLHVTVACPATVACAQLQWHVPSYSPCGLVALAPVVWGIRIQPTFALVRVVRGD